MLQIFKRILPLIGKWRLLIYVFLGIFQAICSFLFISLLTRVIALISNGRYNDLSKEYVVVFLSIILLIIWTRKTTSQIIMAITQSLIWKHRKQILSLLLKANYQQLSSRKIRVFSAIVHDANVLTSSSMGLVGFFTSLTVAIACIIYLASISTVLFLITLVTILIGIAVYYKGSKRDSMRFEKARNLENDFLKNLNSILDGYKEIFMEPEKGRDLYENNIKAIANDSYKISTTAYTGFLNNQIIGQVLFYILIISVLLYFSVILKIKSSDCIRFVFILLYLLSSVENVMGLLPALANSKISSNHLIDLQNELEEANFNNEVSGDQDFKHEFNEISVKELQFHYENADTFFHIGPIDFNIKRGEVVFIYGPNGCGKTTFVNSILGLYIPAKGEIRLNDILINNGNYLSYRGIFSVVFSDFYLFDELIGVKNLNVEKWNFYCKLFELETKVVLDGKRFSITDLSTGQRKRLALIASLIEEKPILVIDEWAADQDPHFRKKFYVEIIPLLKAEGITILAITHDDQYYYCADRLYQMQDGKIKETLNFLN